MYLYIYVSVSLSSNKTPEEIYLAIFFSAITSEFVGMHYKHLLFINWMKCTHAKMNKSEWMGKFLDPFSRRTKRTDKHEDK